MVAQSQSVGTFQGNNGLLIVVFANRKAFVYYIELMLIFSSETMSLVQIVGFLQVASLALFVCVLLAVDGILYNIFDLIRRHTFTTYSVTSEHKYRLVYA